MRQHPTRVLAAAAATALMLTGAATAAAAEDAPVEAGITVPKVEGMGDGWINGVDVSSVLSLEESGVVFRDDSGAPADLFDVLADHSVNWVRVRVWNDPFDAQGAGYGAGNTDAARATEIAKRATDAGMRVLVNFHYSDFWAHPGQQILPKAWQGFTLAQRVEAVRDYTAETLTTMAGAGVDVGMVQIGNENTGGQIAGTSSDATWSNTSQIFQAGSEAVRAVYPDAKVAVHFTNPNSQDYHAYAQRLASNGVDYDVFLSSYYPYWHGSLENLTAKLDSVATAFDKEVAVAEVSWARTLEDGDGHQNVIRTDYPMYSTSIQGQALAVRDVMQAVANVSGGKGLGTFYWEPAWLPVGPASDAEANRLLWEQFGSGWATSASYEYIADPYYGGSAWENQALFDYAGNPLESLRVYEYAVTGSVAPRVLDSVAAPSITITEGGTLQLPASVDVRYTDGVTEPQTVTWSAKPEWIVDAGTYAVPGVTAAGHTVTATVTVLAAGVSGENVVVNPGFESGRAPWTGSGSGYTISSTSDPYEGSRSTHFWSPSAYSFTIQQQLTGVAPGTYRLTAKVQGGDHGPSDTITIAASSGIGTVTASARVEGYAVWQTPTTDLLSVAGDGAVTVSATLSLSAGAWGTLDNFALVAEEPYVPADTAALAALVGDAESIDREGLSVVSLYRLDRALVRAGFILDSPAPGQGSVDAGVAALDAALASLEPGDGTIPDPTVHAVTVVAVEGDPIVMPDAVTVEAYDETTTRETVVWNDVDDLLVSPGAFTVTGVTQHGWRATATVTVTARNWIGNGGFERGTSDVSPWAITAGDVWPPAALGTAWVGAYADIEGSYALNGWSSTANAVDFWISATQTTAQLPAGRYRLSATSAGGNDVTGGASSTVYELGAWDGVSPHTTTLGLPGWPHQDSSSVEFALDAPRAVDVWVSADLVRGDWSYVDDVRLVGVADPSVDISSLAAAVDHASSLDRDRYTSATLAALDLALERARIVLAAERPTQEMADRVAAEVDAAVAGLAEPPAACTVAYEPRVQPHGRFAATLRVTNASDAALEDWVLTWTFAGAEQLTAVLPHGFIQTGATVAVGDNDARAKVLRPGNTLTLRVTGTGDPLPVDHFALNGMRCATS